MLVLTRKVGEAPEQLEGSVLHDVDQHEVPGIGEPQQTVLERQDEVLGTCRFLGHDVDGLHGRGTPAGRWVTVVLAGASAQEGHQRGGQRAAEGAEGGLVGDLLDP